ncbi:hypothetical protein TNCV_181011 [Trichonephila clavipes]|nr:hypothetical protein TNCV_181011 [Trichonephila clavipes]
MSKCKSLSIKEINLIPQKVDKDVKKKDIALKFGIPPSSLSTIIKNQDKLQTYDSLRIHVQMLRFRRGSFEVDTNAREKYIPIFRPFVVEKAH